MYMYVQQVHKKQAIEPAVHVPCNWSSSRCLAPPSTPGQLDSLYSSSLVWHIKYLIREGETKERERERERESSNMYMYSIVFN